jgi:hypothetical protein
MSQASWNIAERLRKMNDQACTLDKRPGHHAEQSERRHTTRDGAPKRN